MASGIFIGLILLLCILTVSAVDPYKVLGVHKSASDADIKKAYKKLSKKYHPDKNQEPGAKDKFVDIAYAYEVLSDATKRQIYDRHGEAGLKQHEGGQHHANPFDMFSNFFGHPAQHDQTRKGPTSFSEFEVSLADMYKGATIDFMIKKRILCDHCRGSGAASDGDIHQCRGCGGSGVKLVQQQIWPGMVAQSQVTCNECGGKGKVVVRKCPHCGGNKIVDHSAHFALEVEPGMPEGHEVVFEGEGDENPDWEPGDVVLRVRSKKEKGGWRRKESSLYWKETIGIDEALLGFERNLTLLDGEIFTLKRDGVTQPGFVDVVPQKGMPILHQSTRGDLFIEYNVILPPKISPQLKKKLSEAFRGRGRGKDEL